MARRIQYKQGLGRFRVKDESVTTWKVVDSDTGETVAAGLGHYEAGLKAAELNQPKSE